MKSFFSFLHARRVEWLVLSGVLVAVSAGAQAQSVVVFANRVTSSPCGTVNAPIYGPQAGCASQIVRGQGTNNGGFAIYTGALLEGTGYTAALFAGTVGTPEGSLTLIGQTTFRTGALAGYVVNTTLPLPGFPPGTPLTFQVRVWDNQGGTIVNWAQASASFAAPLGASGLFTPSCPTPPPGQSQTIYLSGMTSFNAYLPGSAPFGIESFTSNVVAAAGGIATLAATVIDCPSGGSVTQQWSRAGLPVPDATNTFLVLSNLNYLQGGAYVFTAYDTAGPTFLTRTAQVVIAPRLTSISKPPGLTTALNYQSAPGSTVSVQFATALGVGGWGTLGSATSATTNGIFNDITATNALRLYRLRLEP